MPKICLFAGTTEGRKLAEYLSGQKADLTVCVATDYGGSLIKPAANLKLVSKRLSAEEIREMMIPVRVMIRTAG